MPSSGLRWPPCSVSAAGPSPGLCFSKTSRPHHPGASPCPTDSTLQQKDEKAGADECRASGHRPLAQSAGDRQDIIRTVRPASRLRVRFHKRHQFGTEEDPPPTCCAPALPAPRVPFSRQPPCPVKTGPEIRLASGYPFSSILHACRERPASGRGSPGADQAGSALWEPSQSTPLPLCLQPQK